MCCLAWLSVQLLRKEIPWTKIETSSHGKWSALIDLMRFKSSTAHSRKLIMRWINLTASSYLNVFFLLKLSLHSVMLLVCLAYARNNWLEFQVQVLKCGVRIATQDEKYFKFVLKLRWCHFFFHIVVSIHPHFCFAKVFEQP